MILSTARCAITTIMRYYTRVHCTIELVRARASRAVVLSAISTLYVARARARLREHNRAIRIQVRYGVAPAGYLQINVVALWRLRG